MDRNAVDAQCTDKVNININNIQSVEGQWARCIFRCPHTEIWLTHLSGLDGPYPYIILGRVGEAEKEREV